MAFELEAIVEGGDTISLSDREPFGLLSARGMAGPPIRRITARGPAQHGDTDLGYRLQPREIELAIGFQAATDAILDGYRDTLVSVFKPLTSTPVSLRVTRDTDIMRQIDAYTVGAIDISLVPEYRPGHYHRAVVRLRAPDPTWYDPVSGTASVQGSATLNPDWYLAGGAIGTARIMMQGTVPAIGEVWSYAGTITDSYTLAFQSGKVTDGGVAQFAFKYGTANAFLAKGTVTNYLREGDPFTEHSLGDFMDAGTANYFVRYGTAGISDGDGDGSEIQMRRGTTAYINISGVMPITGTARFWRDMQPGTVFSWGTPIPRYALYSPGLTYDELSLVDAFMAGNIGGTTLTSTFVQLQGDMPDLPTLRITGPITQPRILNTANGQALDFGTVTVVPAGTVIAIDLRHGYKTVTQGTVNKRGELEPWSDLGTWHLTPDTATGTNPIIVYGTNTGTATKVEVIYHHRYSSY